MPQTANITLSQEPGLRLSLLPGSAFPWESPSSDPPFRLIIGHSRRLQVTKPRMLSKQMKIVFRPE